MRRIYDAEWAREHNFCETEIKRVLDELCGNEETKFTASELLALYLEDLENRAINLDYLAQALFGISPWADIRRDFLSITGELERKLRTLAKEDTWKKHIEDKEKLR